MDETNNTIAVESPEGSSTQTEPAKEEKKKKKRGEQGIVFARPPFAEELFTDEGRQNFNKLPGWQRQLVKQVMKHGDLALAAKESGVSRYVKENFDVAKAETKTMVDSLNEGGLTTDYLISHLKECLEANTVRMDKHQNVIQMTDLDLKLKTIELILKVRGELSQKALPAKKDGIVDLFADTKLNE